MNEVDTLTEDDKTQVFSIPQTWHFISNEVIENVETITDTSPVMSMDNSLSGKIVEVVEGLKRKSKIFIDEWNYAYLQNKKRKKGSVLRCCEENCLGSAIYMEETGDLKMLTKHLHQPNLNMVNECRFLKKVKDRVESENTKLKDIYNQEAGRFEGMQLPSFSQIQNTLKRRKKAAVYSLSAAKKKRKHNNIESDDISVTAAFSNEILPAHFIAGKHMEVIEGPKRFSKIYIDDFSYCYQINRKRLNGGVFLRCHKDGCRGSGIYYAEEGDFKKLAKHSHYADPRLVTKLRFLHSIKKRAETETVPLKTIYDEEKCRFTNCDLPPFRKVESTLQKRRKVGESKTTECSAIMECKIEKLEKVTECFYREDDHNYPHIQKTQMFLNPPEQSLNVDEMNLFNPTTHDLETEKTTILVNTLKEDIKLEVPDLDMRNQSNNTKVKSKTDIDNRKKKRQKSKIQSKRKRGRLKSRRASRVPRIKSEYQSKMEIIEGQKRYSKIYIDEASYAYLLNKAREDGVLILKCSDLNCRGSGFYNPKEENFRRLGEHHHEPNEALVQKCKLLSSLKSRAEVEATPLRTIYEEECKNFPGVKIPSFHKLGSTLQKRRRATVPQEPDSIAEAKTQIDTFFVTQCGRQLFRQHLRSRDDSHIFVFTSDSKLEFRNATFVHFDSSFKIIPNNFAQMLLIHMVYEEHAFPVVYALFSKRSLIAYLCLFDFLSKEFSGFSPSTVTTDYEFDLERALQIAYPSAIISGCWFHYVQAVWRHSELSGLARVFFQDEKAKELLLFVMSLPLLPAVLITPALSILRTRAGQISFLLKETEESMRTIFHYVQEHWLKRIGIHRLSLFKMDNRRLSYDLESLYHFFIRKIGTERPGFIRFLEKLLQCESFIDQEFHSKKNGGKIRNDRSRNCYENERIIKTAEGKLQSNSLSIVQFLSTVASCVPKLYHHENCAHLDNIVIALDPADVPDALPLCEIRLSAPDTEDTEDAASESTVLKAEPEASMDDNLSGLGYIYSSEAALGSCITVICDSPDQFEQERAYPQMGLRPAVIMPSEAFQGQIPETDNKDSAIEAIEEKELLIFY